MNKSKVISIAGIILLVMLVFWSPFERKSGGFTDALRAWGVHQQEASDEITNAAVSGFEGDVVGEHKVDGSNWSIPNIIRHLLGVDGE